MTRKSSAAPDPLRLTVETFWETFPPFWHRIRAHIRQLATDKFEISVEQFHILRHIRQGRCSVSELAEAKNISRPAISQGVDVLVHKGFITRSTDPLDRRHVRLALTASGDALLDAIFGETREWMMRILSALSEQELHDLTRAMELLEKTQPA